MTDRKSPARWTVAVVAAAATLILVACPKHSPDVDRPPADAAATGAERWYGIYMQGTKIGHMSIRERTFEENGETLVETTMSVHIAVVRGPDTLRQELQVTSVETPIGQLRRFETEGEQAASGSVVGDVLNVRSAVLGDRQLPWQPTFGGPFAWEKLLARSPPGPKETRKFQALEDSFLVVADHELIGGEREPTATPSGVKTLRRIEHRMALPNGQALSTRLWIDERGNWIKAIDDATGWELHLLSREAALAPAERQVDLVYDTMVKLPAPLPRPRQTQWARYRITVGRGDPLRLLAAGPSQAVRRVDQHTVEVVVRSVRPDGDLADQTGGASFPAENQPADPSSLAANHHIASADPRVAAMARRALAEAGLTDDADPWTVAVALERHVRSRMNEIDYSQAFLTAAEVAEQLRGDCSEFAVLLAALLRVRGIPSRVAVGLVYVEPAAAMGYHMWTEAWIGGRWIGLDATLAHGGIAADHIKIGATSLERGLADPAVVAIAQLLGAKPRIEVVEVRHRER